jgi:hypothetical protein
MMGDSNCGAHFGDNDKLMSSWVSVLDSRHFDNLGMVVVRE